VVILETTLKFQNLCPSGESHKNFSSQGKLFFLKQNLTCSNFGIHAAQFAILSM